MQPHAKAQQIEASATFKIKNAGLWVYGRFEQVSGQVIFDGADGPPIKISGTAWVSSINTGIRLRDRHLQDEAYFYAAKHPLIEIQSIKIESLGGVDYKGLFQVKIKHITKTIEIPFKALVQPQGRLLLAHFTINRRDFEVGGKSLIMGDEVYVNVEFKLIYGK